MKVTTTMELERGEEIIPVTVVGYFQPGEPGGWEHPGEEPHFEDITVLDAAGQPLAVSLAELAEAEAALEDVDPSA